jgi:hypothetical protein
MPARASEPGAERRQSRKSCTARSCPRVGLTRRSDDRNDDTEGVDVRRQDSGRTPPRTPDAPSVRERREIARIHRGIERAQADVRHRARQQPSQPRLAPISAANAKVYASHPHPSTAEVRANVVARAALRHLQRDLARSRRAAPGPGVSGYRFLVSAVGPTWPRFCLAPSPLRANVHTRRGVASR